MEFVQDVNLIEILEETGISVREEQGLHYLEMADDDEVVHFHLAEEGNDVPVRDGAKVYAMARDTFAGSIEDVIHKLRIDQVLLVPVSEWRNIFDAVAFSLATNEDWQEFDATATVKLNTRDPMLCEPADFQTLSALLQALVNDSDNAKQGLLITTTATPVLVEFVPEGAVRISVGNAVLADEVLETLQA